MKQCCAIITLFLATPHATTPGIVWSKVCDTSKTRARTLNKQLLRATCQDDIIEVKQLIAEGANINYTNGDGITPLYHAVKNENQKMLRYLIQSGADVTLSANTPMSPLIHAVNSENVTIASLLLEAGAPINHTIYKHNSTPLWVAVHLEQIEMIQLLIKQGADITIRDSYGRTPEQVTENQEIKTLLTDHADTLCAHTWPDTLRKKLSHPLSTGNAHTLDTFTHHLNNTSEYTNAPEIYHYIAQQRRTAINKKPQKQLNQIKQLLTTIFNEQFLENKQQDECVICLEPHPHSPCIITTCCKQQKICGRCQADYQTTYRNPHQCPYCRDNDGLSDVCPLPLTPPSIWSQMAAAFMEGIKRLIPSENQ